MSPEQFARFMGVSPATVMKRIAAGTLTTAVKVKGRWQIDSDKAKVEWETKTRPWVKARTDAEGKPSALAEATLRERLARAVSIELETEKRAGRLVAAADIEQVVVGLVVQARLSLLGLPTRLRQQLPHMTATDAAVCERLVREILTEMAEQAGRIRDDQRAR